jgi:hypothetical protein
MRWNFRTRFRFHSTFSRSDIYNHAARLNARVPYTEVLRIGVQDETMPICGQTTFNLAPRGVQSRDYRLFSYFV